MQAVWVWSPDWGTKVSHASWPKIQNINNRSTIVTNSIKTLNNGPHQKKKNLRKWKQNSQHSGYMADSRTCFSISWVCPRKKVEFLGSKKYVRVCFAYFGFLASKWVLPSLWLLNIVSVLPPWSCVWRSILKSWKYRDGCPENALQSFQGRFTFRVYKCVFKILAFV